MYACVPFGRSSLSFLAMLRQTSCEFSRDVGQDSDHWSSRKVIILDGMAKRIIEYINFRKVCTLMSGGLLDRRAVESARHPQGPL